MPKITFLPDGKTVEGGGGGAGRGTGAAEGGDLPHNCGGVCACTTCHVWIEQGLASLSELEDREDDKLNEAAGLSPSSRLGCQAEVGGEDVVVRLPGNRIAS
jgi:ferredoxin, 2Fe-2S